MVLDWDRFYQVCGFTTRFPALPVHAAAVRGLVSCREPGGLVPSSAPPSLLSVPEDAVPETSTTAPSPSAPWPRLVADIGGTNVRFALIAHPGDCEVFVELPLEEDGIMVRAKASAIIKVRPTQRLRDDLTAAGVRFEMIDAKPAA